MKPKKVYIVTSGDYSGYAIDAVFDDKAMAEQLVRVYGGRVETWPLNQLVDPLTSGKRMFGVALNPDGSVKDATQFSYLASPQFSCRKDGTYWAGWATDERHAVKIAQDKRAERLAKKAGVA